MPTVSVIVPVYKSVNCLEKAVDSVLSQSFTDFEILLVDDGSPDESLDLCYKLSERDSRIKALHKENGGICSARNYGLENATGKYIAFLDHDDEYMPGYFEDNIKLLELYQADFIKFGKNYRTFDENGVGTDHHDDRMLKSIEYSDGVSVFKGQDVVSNYVKFRNAVKTMFIWDGIYSSEFLRNNSITFDISYKYGHEDNRFNIEIYKKANCIVFSSGEYYIHNFDEVFSTSSKFNFSRIDDSIKAAKAEADMLYSWNVQSEIILEGYMDEFFRLMNIINYRGGNLSYKQKKGIMNNFLMQTLRTMPDIKIAIKNLFKINKKTAIWAWCLNKKLFALVYIIEKAYRLVVY